MLLHKVEVHILAVCMSTIHGLISINMRNDADTLCYSE